MRSKLKWCPVQMLPVLIACTTLLIVSIDSESSKSFLYSKCSYLEFECKNGKCINDMYRCDSMDDCGDGSDEIDCKTELHQCTGSDWFKCDNDECITALLRCDGIDNCADHSDEKNCDDHANIKLVKLACTKQQFTCDNGECIDSSYVCDGSYDCSDLSDENNCTTVDDSHFKCKNGHILPLLWACDGVNDCGDNSDEIECHDHKAKTPDEQILQHNSTCDMDANRWRCKSDSKCIAAEQICNGIHDCQDGSDEGGECQKSCGEMRSPCTHGCFRTPNGPFCPCPEGYVRLNDTSCKDLDECEQFDEFCSQTCTNYPGTFRCSCVAGYDLQPDNRTCKARGEALLVFASDKINGYYLHSNKLIVINNDTNLPVGVTYDGNYVYWTEIHAQKESIVRSRLNGTELEVIVSTGLVSPEDIAIDWYTKNIYFTDSDKNHIAVCSGDGVHCTVLIGRNMDNPRAIVLNSPKGEMYWTDWGKAPEIARANMDGSNDRTIVSTDILWPNGLTLDYPNNKLYWVDGERTRPRIESANLDGSNRKVVAYGLGHPYWIAVFEDNLYWSDWETKSLQVCNKFNQKDRRTLFYDTKIFGIHIHHPLMMRHKSNPCDDSPCSHLCLLSGSNSYKCACPEGKELNPDRKSCNSGIKNDYLIIGINNILITLHHQLLGKQNLKITKIPIYRVDLLVYDSLKDRVIAYDKYAKAIYAIDHFDYDPMVSVLVNTDIGHVEGMDFDYVTNNIYWSDSEKKTLEVLSLTNSERTVLLKELNGDVIVDFVLVPQFGLMFLALRNPENLIHIFRTGMDGKNKLTPILSHSYRGPKITLSYDLEGYTIFIGDVSGEKIDIMSIEGHVREVFVELDSRPGSVAILGKNIFWAYEKSKTLFWTAKNDFTDNENSFKRNHIDVPSIVDQMHLVAVVKPKLRLHECVPPAMPCSHICLMSEATGLADLLKIDQYRNTHTCACPTDMVLKSDRRTCEPDLMCYGQFACKKTKLCIDRSKLCDGTKDCGYGEDEEMCPNRISCDVSYQFKCANGTCITKERRCDKFVDCADGSDEEDCDKYDPGKKCAKDEYACLSGVCIDNAYRCDGVENCLNGDDERDCEFTICASNEFRCLSGTCISKYWECDGRNDCNDNSDEHNKCPNYKPCDGGMFRCDNHRCIDGLLHCNQLDDCGDSSDEIDCLTPEQIAEEQNECTDAEYACSTDKKICLPYSARCNGTTECPKGEDELGCGEHKNEVCREGFQWRCLSDGKCIPNSMRCDYKLDCLDGSDENKEMCTVFKANSTAFDIWRMRYKMASNKVFCNDSYLCKSGECVDYDRVCNGKRDCSDGSDEDGFCDTACSSTYLCDYKCIATPVGGICACGKGKKLATNGHSCEPLPPACQVDPPPCHHICIDVDTSYTCKCFDGYGLGSDRHTCKARGEPMSILFFTYGELRRFTPRNNTMKVLLKENVSKPKAIAVLAKRRAIVYSIESLGQIYRFDYDTNETLVHKVGGAKLLTVDWLTENVYFSTSEAISICDVNTGNCARLRTLDSNVMVTALRVDPISRVLFYATTERLQLGQSSSVVYRTNLDGSEERQLAKDELTSCSGLAIDHDQRLVYFADRQRNKIERMDYDGNQRRVVAHDNAYVNQPMDLELFEDEVYFVLYGTSKMGKCKVAGGDSSCEPFNLNAHDVERFAVEQSNKQTPAPNFCLQAECAHVCVVVSPEKVKCLCENGTEVPERVSCNSDGKYAQETAAKGKSTGSIIVILVTICFFLAVIVFMYRCQKKQLRKAENGDASVHFHNPHLHEELAGYGVSLGGVTSKFPILPNAMQNMQNEYTNPLNAKLTHDWPPQITMRSSESHLQKKKVVTKDQIEVPKLLADSDSDVESDRDFHDSDHTRLLP